MEVDVLIPEHEEKADLIDGAIGELSPFHHTYGYYARKGLTAQPPCCQKVGENA
jgi:hypothetical protein